MPIQLFISPSHGSTFLLNLISSYLKLQQRGKVNIIYLSDSALKAIKNGNLKLQVPSLVTEDGQVISQPFKITHALLSLTPQWEQFFLGSNEEEKAEITNVKTHLKQGKQLRKYLQKHLESRTFFVANHLTFADLYMFTQLFDNLIEMNDDQKNQYNNLFRWFKHIQNLPEVKEFLQKSNKLLIADPQIKVNFLEKKKKSKKEKVE